MSVEDSESRRFELNICLSFSGRSWPNICPEVIYNTSRAGGLKTTIVEDIRVLYYVSPFFYHPRPRQVTHDIM